MRRRGRNRQGQIVRSVVFMCFVLGIMGAGVTFFIESVMKPDKSSGASLNVSDHDRPNTPKKQKEKKPTSTETT